MSLQNSLKEIRKICLERYKGELAAILVFGSANTGNFVEGKSDIDTIILFKDKTKLNLEEEKKLLFKKTKPFNWFILHFRTLSDYKKHIYHEGSWSSWLTVIRGSKKLYKTKDFEKFRRQLIRKPIQKKKLFEYLKNKDKIELDGYLKRENGWALTKGLFSHIRRKLQILNYFKASKLIFDFDECLKNINLENKKELEELSKDYKHRRELSKKETEHYYRTARGLTNEILSS